MSADLHQESLFQRIAAHAAAAAILLVDEHGQVRQWSASARALFGWDTEAAIGTPLTTLVPFLAANADAVEGWCRRADGSRFLGRVATVAVDAGDPRGQAYVVVDLSAPAAPPAAPRDPPHTNEATLQAVLDATIDGIMTIDASGRIEAVNRTLSTMMRCRADVLIGASWQAVLDVPSGVLPAPGRLHELTGRRADGSEVPLECGISEIRVEGRLLLIAVVRDISERRALERQLLDVSEQLQRQIGQDLHDGLGQLLTGAAFLAKGLSAHVGADYQTQARRIVELINHSITRVRSLARGLSPIHVEAQSLVAVMGDVVADSSRLLGVECTFERHDAVESDRPATISQLCLLAREAITNAVRHGQAHRIVVRLSRDGFRSLLAIEDDGTGINPGGPLEGLGLRSMRHRAQIIGGSLEVSRAEVGTVVRCWWSE